MKYLVAIAVVLGLYMWFTHRSATQSPQKGSVAVEGKPAAVAAAGTPTPTALRRPIVRTQEVLKQVNESRKEE